MHRNVKKILNKYKTKPRISTQGYYFILDRTHHRSNKSGYTKVADLVLEQKIGRKLRKNEIAHHINSIRTDDRPNNLEVMTKKQHDSHTTRERWNRWRESNRWSYKYPHCVFCNENFRKHARQGLCTKCSHYYERGTITLDELMKLQNKCQNLKNIKTTFH